MIAALPQRQSALEIGTGTGVLMERMQAAGFADVIGIEPSVAAIAAANPGIRPHIREGIFTESDFVAESFDLICCNMTLEHVSDPGEMVRACARLLRPGGVLAMVTHDYTATLNRLLGRRSPIIDIEHLQLFCPASLDRLLTLSGLVTQSIAPLVNRYPIGYWARLSPLPAAPKRLALGLLDTTGLAKLRLAIGVGNLMSIGRKA